MIAQRMVHREEVRIVDGAGAPVTHTPEFVGRLFDEELARLVESPRPGRDLGTPETMAEARRLSEELIRNGWFNPV